MPLRIDPEQVLESPLREIRTADPVRSLSPGDNLELTPPLSTKLNKLSGIVKAFLNERKTNEGLQIRNLKSSIYRAIESVNKQIKISPTADELNPRKPSISREEIFKIYAKKKTLTDIRRNPYLTSEEKLEQIFQEGVGNCEECAYLLYRHLMADPTLPQEIKNQIKICKLKEPDDHAFVLIGDIEDPNALVADAWIKYLDLQKIKNQRPQYSPASKRERGFVGTKKQHDDFLKAHEGNRFITAHNTHQAILVKPKQPHMVY